MSSIKLCPQVIQNVNRIFQNSECFMEPAVGKVTSLREKLENWLIDTYDLPTPLLLNWINEYNYRKLMANDPELQEYFRILSNVYIVNKNPLRVIRIPDLIGKSNSKLSKHKKILVIDGADDMLSLLTIARKNAFDQVSIECFGTDVRWFLMSRKINSIIRSRA